MENIIVRDYIESLNESNELDYIFPLLLESMGFRIITTPKQSKGQSQYGKDIVAVRYDDDVLYKYYFELKGFYAKDITDTTLYAKDGFIQSILAAKYTAYNDSSIRINNLPVKIIYVHNGVLQENTRPTFDGFIKDTFKDDESFERWDIYKLTELFSKHLFSEYILTDEESVKLFKRILVLIDAPEYNLADFHKLVSKQFVATTEFNPRKKREVNKLFASLQLLNVIVMRYCEDNNNLAPAKECVTYTVIETWHWILINKLEGKRNIISKFNRLCILLQQINYKYFAKTLRFAEQYKGLYCYNGAIGGEEVCYPLRCFDYINDLIVFYYISNAYNGTGVLSEQKEQLKSIIDANPGCESPLIDIHSNTIKLIVFFLLQNGSKEDLSYLASYIVKLTSNVILRYKNNKTFPELNNNKRELARSYHRKREEYADSSSLLLLFLIELIAYFDIEELYSQLRSIILESDVNLQVVYARKNADIELAIMDGNVDRFVCVETSISIPETIEEFRSTFRKRYNDIEYRTDSTNFYFMRILAHIYYEIDFLPDFLNLGYAEIVEDLSKK